MEKVKFKRWDGERPYVYTFWPDGELKMFHDDSAAERWADRKGLKAEFEKQTEPPAPQRRKAPQKRVMSEA